MRGAPAIAIVGCLSLAVELLGKKFDSVRSLADFIVEKLENLVTSRPTAVNMKEAAVRFSDLAKSEAKKEITVDELRNLYVLLNALCSNNLETYLVYVTRFALMMLVMWIEHCIAPDEWGYQLNIFISPQTPTLRVPMRSTSLRHF